MPAVGYLRCAGSAFCQSLPVDVRAVTCRHLHLRAGMIIEPGYEALLGAFLKQIHNLAAFEVHEDGAVRAALLERKVVHPEHPHLPDFCQGRTLDPLQYGVASSDDTQLGGQPGACSASEFEGDREQSLLQPIGLAGTSGYLRQPLAEDPPLARSLVAEEAADTDIKFHADPVPG